jgi:hypothetical protein
VCDEAFAQTIVFPGKVDLRALKQHLTMRSAFSILAITAIAANAQTITSFPYATSFEGAVGNLNENFPAGWLAQDLNTPGFGNQGWQIIKNSQSAENARTDSTAVHMFSNFNDANNDWLFTPAIETAAGSTYTLTFWYRVADLFPSVEKLEIKEASSQDAASASGTALWSNTNITNTAWAQGSASFTAGTTGQMHFAFHCFSAAEQFILLVDDVVINSSTVGIGEHSTANNMHLFPNPASNLVHLSLASHVQNANVELIGADGRLLKLQPIQGDLDVSHVEPGTYAVRVRDSAGSLLGQGSLVIIR